MSRLNSLICGQRGEVAGDAHAAAIADLALTVAGGAGQAAFLLAAVDDDRHVRIVFVIALELGDKLVGQGFRYDAVDHEIDRIPVAGGLNSVMCRLPGAVRRARRRSRSRSAPPGSAPR